MMKKTIVSVVILSAVLCVSGNVLAYSGDGDGSAGNPYKIGSLSNWQTLIATPADWGSCFILTADLNWGGLTLTPVGNSTNPFTGIFDGNGHTISNFVISLPSTSGVGLFGSLDSGGKILNLGVENMNITGKYGVGGLVGNCDGTIMACYTTGSVSGTSSVGGLVGGSDERSTILSCYSTCSVSGSGNVGGLVSYNFGTIKTCYAAGFVSGSYEAGGLVAGEEGDVTSCFWDMQTSEQSRSYGGIGLPTLSMYNPDIYLSAYWDFKGEIINGTEDIWAMPQGGGYPVLAWQLGNSPVENDEMSNATSVTIIMDMTIMSTSIGATGLDLTRNGYKDSADVWYYFDCTSTGKYSVTVTPDGFNSTLGVFDTAQTEIVFNDDFFGEKSAVILNAVAGQRYYIRVAGYNGQTGNFAFTLAHGAIQAIQGDLNYDGMVNLIDFSIMADNWLIGI